MTFEDRLRENFSFRLPILFTVLNMLSFDITPLEAMQVAVDLKHDYAIVMPHDTSDTDRNAKAKEIYLNPAKVTE